MSMGLYVVTSISLTISRILLLMVWFFDTMLRQLGSVMIQYYRPIGFSNYTLSEAHEILSLGRKYKVLLRCEHDFWGAFSDQ